MHLLLLIDQYWIIWIQNKCEIPTQMELQIFFNMTVGTTISVMCSHDITENNFITIFTTVIKQISQLTLFIRNHLEGCKPASGGVGWNITTLRTGHRYLFQGHHNLEPSLNQWSEVKDCLYSHEAQSCNFTSELQSVLKYLQHPLEQNFMKIKMAVWNR